MKNRDIYFRDPTTVVGASDAGAHLQMMCGAGDTTLLLTTHVRDRGGDRQADLVATGRDAPAAEEEARGNLIRLQCRKQALSMAARADGISPVQIVHRRAPEHGRIWSRSEPGRGAIFSIALPLTQ